MTIKALAAAVALTVVPAFAYAECSFGKHQAAMSCADGTVYDAQSGACVATTG